MDNEFFIEFVGMKIPKDEADILKAFYKVCIKNVIHLDIKITEKNTNHFTEDEMRLYTSVIKRLVNAIGMYEFDKRLH